MNLVNFLGTGAEYAYLKSITSFARPSKELNSAIENFQNYKLRKLVKHAYLNSEFYRELYSNAGIHEDDIPYVKLHDLPIVSKSEIIENIEYIWTDKTLKHDYVSNFIEQNKGKTPVLNDRYYCFTTSGSTGKKLPVLYSKQDWQSILTTIFIHGFRPSKPWQPRTKIAALLLTGGTSAGIATLRALPKQLYEVKEISLLNNIDDIILELNEFQPDHIGTYPGIFHSLVSHQKSGNLKIAPKLIIFGGEKISYKEQLRVSKVFNCRVMNNYGASEAIIIGTKDQGEEIFKNYSQLSKLEVLNNEGQSVQSGESGNVVLTNFINYTQPFIRYSIGDRVSTKTNKFGELCAKDFVARNLKPVYFHLENGEKHVFHPAIFHELAIDIPGVERFQIVIGNQKVFANIVGSAEGANTIKMAFAKFIETQKLTNTVGLIVNRVPDLYPEETGKIPFIKYETTQIA